MGPTQGGMMRIVWLCCLLVGLGCNRIAEPGKFSAAEAENLDAAKAATNESANSVLARPVAAIERALVISIDGLRPDLALRASTPRLRHLCETGSFTFWAETVPEAYTLPAHVSMLTGCSVARHGV